MTKTNYASALLIIYGSIVALIYGKSVLMPLLVALLIYFLIRSIRRLIDRSSFLQKFVPNWLKNAFASLLILFILILTGEMLVQNTNTLVASFTAYQSNINALLKELNSLVGLTVSNEITQNLQLIKLEDFLNPLLNSLTGFMGNSLMVPFYLLFLFIEETSFQNKLLLIYTKQSHVNTTKSLLSDIEKSITQYIGLKTLVSLLTGAVCGITFLAFGLESPLLWAFVLFIMNFIPIIGSLLAVLFPTFFALLQFGDFSTPALMLAFLIAIQMIIGNILEPKIMGDSLNISPLVALFSLAFWGAIWGITGMLVSVPITVILIILLAHFPSTKNISILLSNTGKV
jgi:predicted PurR-regulated permease PerM